MFTLAAFDASVDGSAALVQVNAELDQSIAIVNNNIQIDGRLPLLVGAFALGGTGLLRVQLDSPSLRALWLPEIAPPDAAATVSTPSRWSDMRFTPFQFLPNEQLSAFVTNGGAAQTIVGAWFADQPIAPVAGEARSIRFTSATTLVANAWTNCALTLTQNLPSGRYQLIGARLHGVSPVLFRVVFQGYPWRPGGPALPTIQSVEHPAFRYGGMGVWGEFTNTTIPTIDVLALAADTAQTGVLDLVYLGQ